MAEATATRASNPTMVYEEPMLRSELDLRSPGQVAWVASVLGVLVLVLGNIVAYVMTVTRSGAGAPSGQTVTWLTFYTFGSALVSGGLALASLWGRSLSWGARTALLLGAAFITTGGILSGLLSSGGLRF